MTATERERERERIEYGVVPDAVTRSACDASKRDIRVALSNRHTVIAGGDIRVGYGHTGVSLEVNAVGIGTVCRCSDRDTASLEVLAAQDSNVEELAIHGFYAIHDGVVHVYKQQRLYTN